MGPSCQRKGGEPVNRIRTWAVNALLVFLTVIFTQGALASAFRFVVDSRVMFLVPGIASLILTGLITLRRGRGLAAGALPVILFVFFRWPDIASGIKCVLFTITYEYNKWLPIPVLFNGSEATPQELSLFFAALGLVLSLLAAATVCLKRSAVLTVVITLPLVFPALMLIEYVPSKVYLVGLLAVYLCLTFASALHQKNFPKREKAVFQAFALVIPLLLTAYLIASPDEFSRNERIISLDRWVRAVLTDNSEKLPGVGWPETSALWRFNTQNVAVANAGERKISDQVLLEINSTQAGSFYLRGYSMINFDGRSWRDNADEAKLVRMTYETHPGSDSDVVVTNDNGDTITYSMSELENGIRITTADALGETVTMVRPGSEYSISTAIMDYEMIERQYMPAVQQTAVIRGYIRNNPNTTIRLADISIAKILDKTDVSYYPYFSETSTYTEPNEAKFYHLEGSLLGLAAELPPGSYESYLSDYNDYARDVYTQVDAETADALRTLAERAGISANASRAEVADRVARYISNAAGYTLTPPVTPYGENFVLYFLQTARRGYCIHFATAATLMLRSLRVPARFTTGFIVNVPETDVGQSVEITDRVAHSWVEVYYDDIGWMPLEVTPPAPAFGIPYIQSYNNDLSGANEVTPSNTADLSNAADGAKHGNQPNTTSAGVIILYVFISTAALTIALILRRNITCSVRIRAFNQDDTNTAVIRAWRYISRLSPGEMPDEYEELALKARFSQHRVTEDERAAITGYATALASEKYEKAGLFQRIWMRYILGL